MKDFWKMFWAALLAIVVGSIVSMMLSLFFVMLSVVQIATAVFPKGVTEFTVPKHSVLKLDFTTLREVAYQNPWDTYFPESDNNQVVTLTQMLNAIGKAKDNPNIEGIYLTTPMPLAGMASLSEVREKLLDFKKSGKFIVAYADRFAQSGYYLASVADELYLHPQGSIDLHGMGSTTLFYKQTLEKFGVEMNVFKVGTYKGAVEPYTNTSLSDANREQMNSFMQALWGVMIKNISSSRNIDPETLNAIVDEGPMFFTTEEYIARHMIDRTVYAREMQDILNERLGRESGSDISFVAVNQMNRTKRIRPKGVGDRGIIRVIYAEGNIVEDIQSGFSNGVITQSLSDKLIKAADDEDVDAIVMRVNSPGGSAFVSDVIWDAVEYVKSKKPIVVSMGDYAASGGYYISCAANYIFAEPTTITGSIGIFGMFPTFAGAANKVALTYDEVKTNKYANFGNVLRPLTEDEKALFQKMVESGYDTFTTRVADGRNLSKVMVDSVGQGRVWTGEQALERKLVDGLGGLDDAIVKAASLAKINSYRVIYSERNIRSWKSIKRQFGLSATKSALEEFFTKEELDAIKEARILRSMTGVQAIMPYDVSY